MSGTDIGKYITRQNAQHDDPEGYLQELPPWSEQRAVVLAENEGLRLSEPHWEVLRYLRERYRRQGRAASGRRLAGELSECFAVNGGRRYLYRLFPLGPVSQGSRIAGLPVPPYSRDLSFGSSE